MEDLSGKVAVVTGGAAGIGRGIVGALLDEGCRVVIADIEAPVLDETVAGLADRGDVRGVVTDVSDPTSMAALADQVYDELRLLPRPVEQRRRDLGRWRQPVGAGAERLAVVLRRQRVRHRQRRPRVRTPDDRRRRAGRGGDHVLGRRRDRPGALRLGVRLVEGGHQLLHRGAGPPVRGPADQPAGGRLLPFGRACSRPACGRPSGTGRRSWPGSDRGRRPREPRSPSSRRRWPPPGAPPTSSTSTSWARFAVQGVKDGKFVISHGLDRAGRAAARPGRRHRPG